MKPSTRRTALLVMLVPYAAIQIAAAVGWIPRYGFDSLHAFIHLTKVAARKPSGSRV